jgi:uracil-DNA glycosylase family protein
VTTIAELAAEAAGCTRCALYEKATATVFGDGDPDARVVVVGEQPGDQEDRQGRPFVGPAGQLLDRALGDAGIDRGSLYVTNAVKHFKWQPRGKRRIHQTPNQTEVSACSPWLAGELATIAPELVIGLGATAGKALLGASFRVTKQRGLVLDATLGDWSGPAMVTMHPSAVLRFEDPEEREAQYRALVEDLAGVAHLAA